MVRKNKILCSDNQLSYVEDIVLRCFFPEGDEKEIKDIKEISGYSYERINTSLKKLEEKKIVSSKKVGRTLVYKADYNNLYLKLAFNHYITETLINFSNKHPIIYKAINEIKTDSEIVLVFGSYSKGNETKNSDIDLMIVSSSEREAEKQINSIKSKYGLNIAPVFVKKSEFPKIKKENPELWADLKNYSLVFNRSGLYYSWMYQNE
ncbi:MAG: nucleotidyltransferase domain-containing protein [Patescibacteria group bacterium]|nr:nucleotidyltransferase domain-containing protein [Nanoarchaeota archaeon]